jgi:hypothetical protein
LGQGQDSQVAVPTSRCVNFLSFVNNLLWLNFLKVLRMTKRGDKTMEIEEFLKGLKIININDPTEELENK